MLTRRRFLASLLPGLALLSGGAILTYVGYHRGSCPLSKEGRCVGPCSALLDEDGDGLCDRIGSAKVQEVLPEPGILPTDVMVPSPTATLPSATPIESVPPRTATPRPTAAPTVTPVPTRVIVACPFGQVNDPYPGRCGRYVDRNGNRICDLSEPR